MLTKGGQHDQYGLYVHIPFCVKKCPYCDFNTFDIEKQAIADYLKALHREMQYVKKEFSPPLLDTLFLGGGTPTVLSGRQLSDVISWVRTYIGLKDDAEITIEANPGSVTRRALEALAAAGVNRVSLGVQSFSDDMLQRIGRNHNVRDVYHSYELIRTAGIQNVSFDLMFALPDQTPDIWKETLQHAIRLRPEHVSCYSLIIEEGTPFAELHVQNALPVPSDDAAAAMYEMAVTMWTEAGYKQYEVSNFAKQHYVCRHNLLYWRNEYWLAAGPGAHGHWQGKRYWNVRGLQQYKQHIDEGRLPIEGYEQPTASEQMDEHVMLGLRLVDGVDRQQFAARYGRDVVEVYADTIDKFVEWRLLEVTAQALRLTERGLMLGNQVTAEFLRSHADASLPGARKTSSYG